MAELRLDDFDENRIEKISLSYLKSDAQKFLTYYLFIEKKIELGEKIPARVLKKFLSFLFDNDFNKSQFIKNHISEACKSVYKLLVQNGYDFTYDLKPNLPFYYNSTNTSLSGLFSYLQNLMQDYEPLIQHITRESILSKNDFIEFIYSHLFDYLYGLPDELQISEYKRSIFVGFTLAAFGILDSEHEYRKSKSRAVYYTEYLNEKTRYKCEKVYDLKTLNKSHNKL